MTPLRLSSFFNFFDRLEKMMASKRLTYPIAHGVSQIVHKSCKVLPIELKQNLLFDRLEKMMASKRLTYPIAVYAKKAAPPPEPLLLKEKFYRALYNKVHYVFINVCI